MNVFVPDYANGTIDVNAIKDGNNNVPKTSSKAGSGTVNIKFSNIVSVDKKNKSAKLYFKNSDTSTKNMMLILLIRQNDSEIVLGQSDLIPPGYSIYNMKLNNVNNLPDGGYKGVLKTVFYDEKSNAKEIIDMVIWYVKLDIKKLI